MTTKKILFVDDEIKVLNAYRRKFRRKYELDIAHGPEEALKILQTDSQYAVVVADMQMPGMNGVELLSIIKNKYGHIVRMMLTGNADQQTAIDAVNDGAIFRFLNKPCDADTFATALNAGLEQHRLITAEQELLQKTLRGSVRVLVDTLSLADPKAFQHSVTIRDRIKKLIKPLNIQNAWLIEISTMLLPLGELAVPVELRGKTDDELSAEERQIIEQVPETCHRLISHIPRLESVAEIFRYLQKNYDGSGKPDDSISGDQIPEGSRLLRILRDLCALETTEKPLAHCYGQMRERNGCYDPSMLDIVAEHIASEVPSPPITVSWTDLTIGDRLAEEVKTTCGLLLVGKGQLVTESIRERLKNYLQLSQLEDQFVVTR